MRKINLKTSCTKRNLSAFFQFDEEAQSSIDAFFHSQLVVPSPAESSCTPHRECKLLLLLHVLYVKDRKTTFS